jgi:hypothetical protein
MHKHTNTQAHITNNTQRSDAPRRVKLALRAMQLTTTTTKTTTTATTTTTTTTMVAWLLLILLATTTTALELEIKWRPFSGEPRGTTLDATDSWRNWNDARAVPLHGAIINDRGGRIRAEAAPSQCGSSVVRGLL